MTVNFALLGAGRIGRVRAEPRRICRRPFRLGVRLCGPAPFEWRAHGLRERICSLSCSYRLQSLRSLRQIDRLVELGRACLGIHPAKRSLGKQPIALRAKPAYIAPNIAAHLLSGSLLNDGDVQEACRIREPFSRKIGRLFAENVLVALPTLAVRPPRRDATRQCLATFRSGCIKLLCLSGLSGCPQFAFPIARPGGNISLSWLGKKGRYRMLLDVAQ
ncbi:Hypothetical protein NGAL_HAMBI1146_54630 [Neorhizobium galegae bv. officinalis]|nr:Hypothetical protein NGAL_HAMBI490_51390 [Neorhizobium galegae bv. officinalis]CDZ42696.1 Hypothetical protein NGAL_HAMBI1146_54630 [Neorhizobium galegae bv. officinalis]